MFSRSERKPPLGPILYHLQCLDLLSCTTCTTRTGFTSTSKDLLVELGGVLGAGILRSRRVRPVSGSSEMGVEVARGF